MHSSTSSSDRAPQGPWLRTWAVAALVAVVVLAGLELFWRAQGHRPSTVDDKDLWAVHRGRARGAADDTVVLVGQSRLQLGFASPVFHARFPDLKLVNLALEGRPPLATLRDLSEDESFAGTVLCSAFPLIFERVERERQLPWVEHFHRQTNINTLLNREIASLVQGNLVVVHPQVRLSEVLVDLVLRKPLPRPIHVVTHADRSKSSDYSLLHLSSHRARRVARRTAAYADRDIPDPQTWRAQVEDVVPWLRRIESRGGRVVFVRFPTTDEHWELDEVYYPRARYWDQLAEITGVPTVHFADDPRTAAFSCPDTSHLDQRDAPRFTTGLLDVLAERGLLPGTQVAATPARGRWR